MIQMPIFDDLRGVLRHDVALAHYTSWRVGGHADWTYTPADADDLAQFLKQLPLDISLTVLGLGSNVLIRDGGVRGVVVLMHDVPTFSKEARLENDGTIYAPAGLPSPKLARFAAAQGLIDAAFLAGIPGTLGGALAMNAGCYGDDTWTHVVRVVVVSRDGVRRVRPASDYETAYRQAHLKDNEGVCAPEIFVGAWWRFTSGDGQAVEKAQAAIKVLLARRRASQPLELSNAGSVFRNPSGDYAARLIEACDLKGLIRGGAMVSAKHANFIVNPQGVARASDIEALITQIQQAVQEKTGVRLWPEVKILGVPDE